MPHRHKSFWVDLAGRMGPPVFAATLVACLLERTFNIVHIGLLVLAFALIVFDHWFNYHKHGEHS